MSQQNRYPMSWAQQQAAMTNQAQAAAWQQQQQAMGQQAQAAAWTQQQQVMSQPGYGGGYGAPGEFVAQGGGPAVQSHYPPGTSPMQGAMPSPPNFAQIGPFVHESFYPTRPTHSVNPGVISRPRFYVYSLLSSDSDYAVGSAANRPLTIALPSVLVVFNAAVFLTAGGAWPNTGQNTLDAAMMQAVYANGEKIHTDFLPLSTTCGTGALPGEVGGNGWPFPAGNTLVLNIMPLLAGLTIKITAVMLEMMPPTTNYL